MSKNELRLEIPSSEDGGVEAELGKDLVERKRKKSVTINETVEMVEDPSFLREDESPTSMNSVPKAAESPMPGRSVLKKSEDIKFVIRSADPIGQDTAVYEFTKYQMPVVDEESMKRARGLFGKFVLYERSFAGFMARVAVLLSRSSGRDKAASVIQYGALFWGTQPFVNITGIEEGPNAPWKKLEDSMSNGRKVFRLLKWIKEYERVRLALTAPDSYLGVIPSRTRALVTRVLAVLMNFFSFWYYFIDNMIWAAQANLINRSPEEDQVREMVLASYPKVEYENYVKLQAQYKEMMQSRQTADSRVERWKDYKNWSSLARLIFALIHSFIQIQSLKEEAQRLASIYSERIKRAQGLASPPATPSSATDGDAAVPPSKPRLERYDSVGSNIDQMKDEDTLARERDQRLCDVEAAIDEQNREQLAAVCNLGILLSRLKFPVFKHMPLWVVGVLGVVAGWCGCLKNWPTYVPKPKQCKVSKRRSSSFEEKSQKSK